MWGEADRGAGDLDEREDAVAGVPVWEDGVGPLVDVEAQYDGGIEGRAQVIGDVEQCRALHWAESSRPALGRARRG